MFVIPQLGLDPLKLSLCGNLASKKMISLIAKCLYVLLFSSSFASVIMTRQLVTQNITSMENKDSYCRPGDRRWITDGLPGVPSQDCRGALAQAQQAGSKFGSDLHLFELATSRYFAPFDDARNPNPDTKVPIRYAYRACNLIITMRVELAQYDLDIETAFPPGLEGTDVSSFSDLAHVAEELYSDCAEHGSPGWRITGGSNSIGVFFWGKGSEFDKLVPQLLAPIDDATS